MDGRYRIGHHAPNRHRHPVVRDHRRFLHVRLLDRSRRIIRNDPARGIVAFIDRNTPTGRIYDANKHDSAFYQEATFYSAAEVKSMLEGAGFASTSFIETIFKDPREMTELEPVKEGTGEGVFCVAKATK